VLCLSALANTENHNNTTITPLKKYGHPLNIKKTIENTTEKPLTHQLNTYINLQNAEEPLRNH
jgi:hypothetical protein